MRGPDREAPRDPATPSPTDRASRDPGKNFGDAILANRLLAALSIERAKVHAGFHREAIECAEGAATVAKRAASHGGRVFHGPEPLRDDPRDMAVFMLPDRHFFEVVGGRNGC